MSLDIDRIAGEDLRTTGKDDALASLILCCPKDIVSPLDIIVKERLIEIGVGIGIGRQMDDYINIATGVLARFEIGDVERNHLMRFRDNLAKGGRIYVGQAECILLGSRTEKCRTNYVAFSPHIHLTAYHMISWNI